MKFKRGEKVCFLQETGTAIIKDILSDKEVLIEDEFGFERNFDPNYLVKIHGAMDQIDSPFVSKDGEDLDQQLKFTIRAEKSNQNQKDYWELDLHMESLTDSHRGMSNFDILKTQMSEFKQFYSRAKASHMLKLVVIHGVGEGVLKNEIRTYLLGQEGVEFFDASYMEYGKGATEIRLRQNG